MSKKSKFTIEEKKQIKRETIAVTIGSSLAALLIIATMSCVSCIDSCVTKNKKTETDPVSYGSFDNEKNNNHRLELKF